MTVGQRRAYERCTQWCAPKWQNPARFGGDTVHRSTSGTRTSGRFWSYAFMPSENRFGRYAPRRSSVTKRAKSPMYNSNSILNVESSGIRSQPGSAAGARSRIVTSSSSSLRAASAGGSVTGGKIERMTVSPDFTACTA